MSNLLDKFNLDAGLFGAVADSPEVYETTGRTTTFHAGRRVAFKGSINGIEVPAYATLHEAFLTRMSVIEQTSPYSGDKYKIVTGILKPVKMTVEVVIDGQTMSLPELLRATVNQSASVEVSEDEFLDRASRIGLKFNEGMPMLFQQFGASENGITKAFELFRSAGAVDVLPTMKNTGNIVAAYAHDAGVPVTSFEVGTTDRSQSRTGQGFLNLVDASVDQFTRIVGLRKEASTLKAELGAQSNWSQDKVKSVEERIKTLRDMSRQWTTNWAGAQRVITVDASGAQTVKDQFAPVNAPCGRLTLVVGVEKHSIDLWKNSAKAESTSAPVASTEADDDAPF